MLNFQVHEAMPGQTQYGPGGRYTQGLDHSYELHPGMYDDPIPSFHFRKRFGEIDWRKLSSIDVDRVARELDFVTLQENISVVTFCNIDAVADLDPLFCKLFKLAQYTIEYLLHSQEYLQSVVVDLESKLETASKEHENLQKMIDDKDAEIEKLKQENKNRRKMIKQQQMLIDSGASSYYQCPHCEKAFMNASFLQGHLQRRHPGAASYIGDVIAHSQREQGKLAEHLKQLEKELSDERQNFEGKLKKAEEEKQLWAEQSRREMDQWKSEEEMKWKGEFDALKESFIQDIGKLKQKEETYQKKIGDLQQTMDARTSNLGDLVDDVQEEKEKLREYEERVGQLEEMTTSKNKQIAALTSAMTNLKRKQQLTQHQKDQLEMSQQEQFEEIRAQLRHGQSQDWIASVQNKARGLAKKKQIRKPRPHQDHVDSPAITVSAENRRQQLLELKAATQNILPSLVDDKLRQCGVDPDAQGISTSTLTNKLLVLKTQRQQLAKSFPTLYKIRDDCKKQADDKVKSLLMERSTSPSRKRRSTSLPPRSKLLKSPRDTSRVDNVTPKTPNAPRSTRRTPKKKKGSSLTRKSPERKKDIGSVTLRSRQPAPSPRATPRKGADEIHSPWDSDDDISDDDASPKVTPVTGGAAAQKVDADWDDIENIDDIFSDEEEQKPKGPGSRVKQTAAALESKLSARKTRPVGGVNVAPGSSSTKVEKFQLSDDEEEEDSFLVSSLEENEQKPPTVRPRSSIAPVRQSTTSITSNTRGTSVWGSGENKATAQTQDDESDWDLDVEDL